MRDIIARQGPVTNEGPHYPLPYPDGTGLGKPLKSTVHPVREDIPIFLGAEGPKNVALAAEICDGWLALFSPRNAGFYKDALAEGFGRPGARRSWDDFEVAATVPVIIHDDVEQAADFIRPMYALYFGGMGARGANFHHDVAVRLGYEAEAKRIQDLYLEGKKDEAAAAVPTQLVEELALIGPEDKIRHDLEAWRESIVTTLVIGGDAATLRRVAGLVLVIAPRPRPRVVISRCIDFDSCRYDGQVVHASLREELAPHVDFVPICPELEMASACRALPCGSCGDPAPPTWCSLRPAAT